MSTKEMHAADNIPSANNLYPSYCIINPLSLARLVDELGQIAQDGDKAKQGLQKNDASQIKPLSDKMKAMLVQQQQL